ncbi:MAG TPA: AAA family ATPase [Nocardioides sp.]|uniref:AAA family ATPase n=1 Tax=Nocardioides sp. TaxID=35761 RepID=UPI002F3E6157
MTLLFVFGPPAVGKMTVGRAIADAGDFRLFHNHHVLEPLLDVFDYGTPPFNRLLEGLRLRVLEEAADAGIDLVYTLVWGLDLPEDAAYVRRHIGPFVERGQRVAFLELYADLDTRLARNRTPYRLAEKKSKRDLAWSDENVRGLERVQMSTGVPSPADEVIADCPHLRIDNTDRPPEDVAAEVLTWLASPAVLGSSA